METNRSISRIILTVAVIAVFTVAFLFLFDRYFPERFSNVMSTSPERGKDYESIAEQFITKNIYIGKKLGKIIDVYHYGKGGTSGDQSFNAFSVRGAEKTGVCHITLTKDNEEMWYVSNARLSVDGRIYEIPVKRSVGMKWKRFKFKE